MIVFGAHFHSGKPTFMWHRMNVDWVPSLNLGHDTETKLDDNKERQERAQTIRERRKRKQVRKEKEAVERKLQKIDKSGERMKDIVMDEECVVEGVEEEEGEKEEEIASGVSTQTDATETETCGTQTEHCDYMFCTQKPWMPEKSEVFTEQYFEGDGEKVRFCTGLLSFEVLKKTFFFISPRVNRHALLLTKFQEFVLVLIKLR